MQTVPKTIACQVSMLQAITSWLNIYSIILYIIYIYIFNLFKKKIITVNVR